MPEQLTSGSEPIFFAVDFTGNSQRGYIVSTQQAAHLPFTIRRAFWSFGVPPDLMKGNHAHRLDQKILVALRGSITVETETNKVTEFVLDSPFKALYVPPLCWIKLRYAPDALLLALSSTDYADQDYIYSYDEFKVLRHGVSG